MANPSNGPKLTDYGSRYYTDSLTKEEQKNLHKWRMKNDLDYKNQIKADRIRKKAAAEKAAAKKTSTSKKTTAKPKAAAKRSTTGRTGRVGRGGAGGAFLENLK